MSLDDAPSFDRAKYTPEMTLAKITELRNHLRDELMPQAAERQDAGFVTRFVSYLDTLATRFEQCVNAPLDLLAFVARNLLEFSVLLPVVFESEDNKALFMNEAYRIDTRDLQTRLDAMLAEVGATLPHESVIEDPEWLPHSNARLAGRRDVFDAWFHKFCSKVMHPTAIMILAPEALTDPNKRVTLCFGGLAYMGKSYNFLAETITVSYSSRESS